MRACRKTAIRALGASWLITGLAGCLTTSPTHVRETTRPDASAALANAPELCPKLPVSSTTSTRGQNPEVIPVSGSANRNEPQVAAKIRASVNGIPILDDELREAMTPFLGEMLQVPDSQRDAIFKKIAQRELDRLIERELILEEAFAKLKALNNQKAINSLNVAAAEEADRRLKDIRKNLKLNTDEELKLVMQSQGLSIAGMKRYFERNFLSTEYMKNVIYPNIQAINLAKIRDYYETHLEEFRSEDKLTWHDIFIDCGKFPSPSEARAFAEQVRGRAAAGEDFAALAKQFDDGDSKLRNGEGLGNSRGQITPPAVEPALWMLKPGQVGPLVDVGFGFHIVKVSSRDYSGQKPFDIPTQEAIRKKLTGIIADREYKRIVDDLKKKATIVVYQ